MPFTIEAVCVAPRKGERKRAVAEVRPDPSVRQRSVVGDVRGLVHLALLLGRADQDLVDRDPPRIMIDVAYPTPSVSVSVKVLSSQF